PDVFSLAGCAAAASLFFFHCYATHRALHSFPTRRSSDLSCVNRSTLLSWMARSASAAAHSRPLPSRRSTAARRSCQPGRQGPGVDRKSTRLNSSHSQISYAVFCLKKKKTQTNQTQLSHIK